MSKSTIITVYKTLKDREKYFLKTINTRRLFAYNNVLLFLLWLIYYVRYSVYIFEVGTYYHIIYSKLSEKHHTNRRHNLNQ